MAKWQKAGTAECFQGEAASARNGIMAKVSDPQNGAASPA
jgi:hypothetical protein